MVEITNRREAIVNTVGSREYGRKAFVTLAGAASVLLLSTGGGWQIVPGVVLFYVAAAASFLRRS